MNVHSSEINFRELYTIKSFCLMIVGILFATFALNGFMIPNGFLDGGVTGISLLIHELFEINLSALLIFLNVLFFILAE